MCLGDFGPTPFKIGTYNWLAKGLLSVGMRAAGCCSMPSIWPSRRALMGAMHANFGPGRHRKAVLTQCMSWKLGFKDMFPPANVCLCATPQTVCSLRVKPLSHRSRGLCRGLASGALLYRYVRIQACMPAFNKTYQHISSHALARRPDVGGTTQHSKLILAVVTQHSLQAASMQLSQAHTLNPPTK